MFPNVLNMAAAEIARLTPNTAPGAWIPSVVYAAVALAAAGIAFGTWRMIGSPVAAAAAAAGYVATSMTPNSVGPLVIALTFLGLFATPANRLPGWLLLALIIPSFFVPHGPVLLAWCLVGCGLHFIRTSVMPESRFAGIGLVAVLVIIVATAPLPAASRSAPPAPAPLGHDRATLTSMRALLSNVPTGSYLVRDDTITGILIRAAQPDFRRARVSIEPIDNGATNIRELLKFRRVFALPHAQRTLAMEGFKIVDSLHVADRGLAEVVAGSDCVTANQTWQTAPQLTGQRDLAFASEKESRRGPVVIYLAGDEPISISAVDWPARTMRGFSPRTFDMSRIEDRQDLERQRTEDGGPRPEDLSAKSITRVALWRMPDAALTMPIKLSAPAAFAAVKLAPEADRPVSVCPVFPVIVSAIR